MPLLSLVKLFRHAEPVPATWDIHYEIYITNTAAISCTNVVVTDTKDSRTYFHTCDPDYDQQIGNDTFVWRLGTLGPGASRRILFNVSTGASLAGQTVHNQATVDSDQSAPLTVVCHTRIGPVPQPSPTNTLPPTPTSTRTATPTATQTSVPTATPTTAPSGTVHLRLDPATPAVTFGQYFDERVMVEAGTQPVAAADAFIDFDPRYLEVISIADGSGLDILLKGYDNGTGQINIGAGNLSVPVQGTFVLVTLHMRAKEGMGTLATDIVFSLSGSRRTTVKDESDHNVLAQAHNARVSISELTPTPTATSTPRFYRLYLPIVMRK